MQQDVRQLQRPGSQVQESLEKVQNSVQQVNQSVGVVRHDFYQVQAELRAEIQQVAQGQHKE